MADPEAPLQRGTKPATQAPEPPPPLLSGASRPLWLCVRQVPATGNDVAGAEGECPRGHVRSLSRSMWGRPCRSRGPSPSPARRRVPTPTLPETLPLKKS